MSRERLVEAFKAKITTKEQFDTLLLEYGKQVYGSSYGDLLGQAEVKERPTPDQPMQVVKVKRDYYPATTLLEQCGIHNQVREKSVLGNHFRYINATGEMQSQSRFPAAAWWAVREWVRYHLGIYGKFENDLLMSLNISFPTMMVRAIADKPGYVQFIDSNQNGERDVHSETTMGRLLRRLYPFAADDNVRDVDAFFRATMSDELELIPYDQISASYLEGPASCMTKGVGHWGAYIRRVSDGAPMHPTSVYERPEFALAVMRNGAGSINARSLVWVNPDNPSDKRYVRIYGDIALERRLQKNGYVHAGLAGAKLNKVQVYGPDTAAEAKRTSKKHYLMPYLDSGTGPNAACYVVGGGDHFLILTTDQARAISDVVGAHPMSASVTGGYIHMPDVLDPPKMVATCALTGVEFDLMKTKSVSVYMNGKLGTAIAEAVEQATEKQEVMVFPDSNSVSPTMCWAIGTVKTVPAKLIGHSVPGVRSKRLLDYFDLYALAEEFYGDVDPVKGGNIREMTKLDDEGNCVDSGLYLRSEDAVHVIRMGKNGRPVRCTEHRSVLLKEKLRQTARVSSEVPCVTAEGVVRVKTVHGTTGVPGIHQLFVLADGTWSGRQPASASPSFWNLRVYNGAMTLAESLGSFVGYKNAPTLLSEAIPRAIAERVNELIECEQLSNDPVNIEEAYVTAVASLAANQGVMHLHDPEHSRYQFAFGSWPEYTTSRIASTDSRRRTIAREFVKVKSAWSRMAAMSAAERSALTIYNRTGTPEQDCDLYVAAIQIAETLVEAARKLNGHTAISVVEEEQESEEDRFVFSA